MGSIYKNGIPYTSGIIDPRKDSYSTSEIECGTWIDGRPVYRRVFDSFTTPVADGTFHMCTPVVPIFDQGGILIKAWALVRNSNNACRIIPVSSDLYIDDQGDEDWAYPSVWIDLSGYLCFKSKEGFYSEIPLTLIIEYVKP